MWENKSKSFVFIAFVLFLIVIFFTPQIFSPDRRILILNTFRFPLKAIQGSYYILRDIATFKDKQYENKILRENILNLRQKVITLEGMRLENERLKKLLNFRDEEQRKLIPCMVIARDALGFKDIIVIDKGKKNGIVKGMPVISAGGFVGRVRETGWSISRVLLIIDADSVIRARVLRTRDEGAIEGNRNLGLVMKYLDLNCDVKKGDKVVTSGFEGDTEKGVLIGDVIAVAKDSSGLYINATIKPSVNMTRIEEVLVVK